MYYDKKQVKGIGSAKWGVAILNRMGRTDLPEKVSI